MREYTLVGIDISANSTAGVTLNSLPREISAEGRMSYSELSNLQRTVAEIAFSNFVLLLTLSNNRKI